jgi:hypothetical protein
MRVNFLCRLEGLVILEFAKLLFKNVNRALDFFLPLFELLTFEKENFIELDGAGGKNEGLVLILEEEHEGLGVILPNLIEGKCAVVD